MFEQRKQNRAILWPTKMSVQTKVSGQTKITVVECAFVLAGCLSENIELSGKEAIKSINEIKCHQIKRSTHSAARTRTHIHFKRLNLHMKHVF